ncbi:MAG: hypothetical protein KC435_06495 [Thermomicrobiales bacterium]|nr:hypothetical protein [Thermomicrobiales bacterium]
MVTTTDSAPKVQFCSVISTESGESPFASAWHAKRFILAEIPLPWKYSVLESPNVPDGLHDLVKGLWAQEIWPAMIGFAPDDEWSVPGHTRIIEFRIPEAPFNSFEQREYLLPTDKVSDLMESFLRDEHGESLEEYRQPHVPDRRDYMVCTHGAIDACCAKFGYPIYKMMRMMAENPDNNMRVWRCTHFGGHRFAPTMAEMPSGRYWGHLEARDLGPIVRRQLPRDLIRDRYRGSALIPNGSAQWAECELFARAGWDWTDTLITPGEAPPHDWENPVEEPQTMSFAFRHEGRGIEGKVDVVVTPSGFIPTTHSSGAEVKYHDEQQFECTISGINYDDFFDEPTLP